MTSLGFKPSRQLPARRQTAPKTLSPLRDSPGRVPPTPAPVAGLNERLDAGTAILLGSYRGGGGAGAGGGGR